MLAMRRRTVVLMVTVGVVLFLGVGMVLASTGYTGPSTNTPQGTGSGSPPSQDPQIKFILDDKMIGTNTADTINTGPGDDLIRAKGGNDTINPGTGNDKVYGGKGDDTIYVADREPEVLVDCGVGFDKVTIDTTGNPTNEITASPPPTASPTPQFEEFDGVVLSPQEAVTCEQVVNRAGAAVGGPPGPP
jgi:hypothetical protein